MRKQITLTSLLLLPLLACSSEPGNATATPCEPGLVLPCDCVFSTGIATCQADGTPGICNCSVRYVGDNPDAYGDAADGVSGDGEATDSGSASVDSGRAAPTDTSIADTGLSDTGLVDSSSSLDTQQPDISPQDTGSAPMQDTSVVDSGVSDASQADGANQDTQSATCTYTLTTIAGSGSVGKQDGKGALARFNSPRGLFWSSAGHLIVADRANHRIRKMTSDGTVTTLAGSGLGSTVGPKGKFAYPGGVFEKAGVIWIADASNDQIRKLAGGVISVVAGIGIQGNSDGGALKDARFTKPQAVTEAPDGSLWVADTHNHRIRRIANGLVSTIAGSSIGGQNGKGKMARFSFPKDLDFLGSFALVADRHNHEIRKVQADGVVTTFAGGAKGDKDGPVDVARFNEPCGVAVDSKGVVWVADRDNDLVRRIAQGVVTTVAGGGSGGLNGPSPNNALTDPWGIAVGPPGVLFISDSKGHRIRKLTCD